MSKGRKTRNNILSHGLDLVSEKGLEALTFGVLAKRVGMSKSGLYAHFESKEALQIAVLDTAAERYIDAVLSPALKHPRGLPRLRALFDLWTVWPEGQMTGGCPFVAAATELDGRPGPVRDRLIAHLNDVLGAVELAADIAKSEGHFRQDLDASQFAYEVWANLVAYHHYMHLFEKASAGHRVREMFDNLLRGACASS